MGKHLGISVVVFVALSTLIGCSDDSIEPRNDVPQVSVPQYVTDFMVPDSASDWTAFDDHLLFCNPFSDRITACTLTGDSLSVWNPLSQEGSRLWPIHLEYSNGMLVIVSAQPQPSRIVVFDSLKVLQREWPEWHEKNAGGCVGGHMITTDRNGNIYTLRYHEETVVKYAPDGTFEREWLTRGINPSEPNWPGAIVIGPNDIVYITDSSHHRVLMFSIVGVFVGQFGERGSGKGQFRAPSSLAIDDRGILYVADTGSNKIQMWTLRGEYIDEFAVWASLSRPLMVTAHGNAVHVWYDDGVVKYYRIEN